MPTKRKALTAADANRDVAPPPAKRAARRATSAAVNPKKERGRDMEKAVEKAKSSTESSKMPQGANGTKIAEASGGKAVPKAAKAAKAEKAPKSNTFKYTNADTLAKAPTPDFVNVGWPQGEEDDDDGDEDGKDEESGSPKVGDILTEEMVKRVSRMGYPITEDGIAKFEWMVEEQDKRDQDLHNMCVYNDFSGYGIGEVVENLLAEFNKILFKKDVSPFKKWAFVEGLATFFKLSCIDSWMMIDDSKGLRETVDMIGTMALTSFAMLAEHGLLSDAPSSPLPTIGITSLLLLEFLNEACVDLDIEWGREVVRALDAAGVELKVRKEVRVSQAHIDEMRAKYKKNEDENLYDVQAKIANWGPDHDLLPPDDGELDGMLWRERKWLRWDWKKEFAKFKVNHPGGNHYNLEKWSKWDKAQYTFGTKEFERSLKF